MELNSMRKEVFQLKPHFSDVVSTFGHMTSVEYYAQNFTDLLNPSEEILGAIETETTLLLGSDAGKRARESVAHHKWTNTADHHGVLCHPYFYATALARSHSHIRHTSNTTVTLPFGNVSLGNDSFPRGFFFHTLEGKLERVFLKSLIDRRLPVYGLSPTTPDILIHEHNRIKSLPLSTTAQERLNILFSTFLADTRIWEQDTYGKQLTILNSVLWNTVFGSSRGDFIYLEIEQVVRNLLIQKHLVTKTDIFNLLFKSEWRSLFIQLFLNVTGSHTEHGGTHFFWYIDREQKTRRRLIIRNNTLTTTEGDIVIPLTPEHIIAGLESYSLMPSTVLTLILVHGVEHLACGGGPSQLAYLSHSMHQWKTLLSHFKKESVFPNTGLYCGDNTLFQIEHATSQTHDLASFIDCFLYTNTLPETIDSALTATPLAHMIDALIPTLYHSYTKNPTSQKLLYTIPTLYID